MRRRHAFSDDIKAQTLRAMMAFLKQRSFAQLLALLAVLSHLVLVACTTTDLPGIQETPESTPIAVAQSASVPASTPTLSHITPDTPIPRAALNQTLPSTASTPDSTDRTLPSRTPTPQLTATLALANTPSPTRTRLPAALAPKPTAAATVVSLIPTPAAKSGTLQVHFIDVGQGDAILILAPDGQVALIDGGDSDSGVSGYLRTMGIGRINLLIATHPHADHIGGLIEALRSIAVDTVVTNGAMHTTLTYERFIDAISDARAEYKEAKRFDTIPFSELAFQVLNPGNLDGDLNHTSLVLLLTYGQTRLLFMADADADAEEAILASGLSVQADVLKVGHHGSNSASSPAFIAQVNPSVAVYSASSGNDYGHPHAETLATLSQTGAQVYGTDVNGTIVVASDGVDHTVRVSRQGEARAPPSRAPTLVPQPKAPERPAVSAPAATFDTLSIEVVSLTSPIARGSDARLRIKTVPRAACTIEVHYRTTVSQAKGLDPKNADENGIVTWYWKVGARTTPGTWHIVVVASVGGQRLERKIPFVVR